MEWDYIKLENGHTKTCPMNDIDGSITGGVVLNLKAWFDESDLDFVVTEEREEWEDNGKDVLSVIKEQLK